MAKSIKKNPSQKKYTLYCHSLYPVKVDVVSVKKKKKNPSRKKISMLYKHILSLPYPVNVDVVFEVEQLL